MVVADALVPLWRQDICNYHDDAGRTTPNMCAQRNGTNTFATATSSFPTGSVVDMTVNKIDT